MKSIKILSGNNLKVIAAIAMVFDHAGLLFFPDVLFFRIIGRLAFPIFAFFIAEGCKYTRNRVRYLAMIAGMAVLFQAVYFIVLQSWYMSVFVTFTFAIILIYLLDDCKKCFLSNETPLWKKISSVASFSIALLLIYAVCQIEYKDFMIDYGFWGCLTPLFASLFHAPKENPKIFEKLDTPPFNALAMLIPLIALSVFYYQDFPVQIYGLLTVPLLFLYSGKRGKWNMKYFFYIFYPAHLVLLYGIAYFI